MAHSRSSLIVVASAILLLSLGTVTTAKSTSATSLRTYRRFLHESQLQPVIEATLHGNRRQLQESAYDYGDYGGWGSDQSSGDWSSGDGSSDGSSDWSSDSTGLPYWPDDGSSSDWGGDSSWDTSGGSAWDDGSTSDGSNWDDGSTSDGSTWDDGSTSDGSTWDDGSTSDGSTWDDGSTSDGSTWDDGSSSDGGGDSNDGDGGGSSGSDGSGDSGSGGSGGGGSGGGGAGRAVDANAMLEAHNSARAEVGVSALGWDANLASSAQAWAETLVGRGCALEHGGHDNMGQNLYWKSPAGFSADEDRGAVQSWVGEKGYWTYSAIPGGCAEGQQCLHYTQVVWAGTQNVGCGAAQCGDGAGSGIWVCHYYPQGNWEGEYPYTT